MWQQITPIVEQINSNIAMINKKQKPTNSFAQINVREFIAAKYMFFNVLWQLYNTNFKLIKNVFLKIKMRLEKLRCI